MVIYQPRFSVNVSCRIFFRWMGTTLEALPRQRVTERVIFLEDTSATNGQHTLTASKEKQALPKVQHATKGRGRDGETCKAV